MPALVKNPARRGGGWRAPRANRLGAGAFGPRSLALVCLGARPKGPRPQANTAAPRAGWVFTLPLGCSA